jgi:hypothetical protein
LNLPAREKRASTADPSHLWVVIVAAGSVVAGVIWLMTGSYGECANDKDCGAGQYCMEWPLDVPGLTKPWWAKLKTYRTCETLCGEGLKPCPPGQRCLHSAHGEPPICRPR